jgi:hypothetical protein
VKFWMSVARILQCANPHAKLHPIDETRTLRSETRKDATVTVTGEPLADDKVRKSSHSK